MNNIINDIMTLANSFQTQLNNTIQTIPEITNDNINQVDDMPLAPNGIDNLLNNLGLEIKRS